MVPTPWPIARVSATVTAHATAASAAATRHGPAS